jgi:type II secretory pathway pseudopilin PulG
LIHIETDVTLQQTRCLCVDWEDQRLQISHRMEERGNPMSQHLHCRIGDGRIARAFTMVDLLVVMVVIVGLIAVAMVLQPRHRGHHRPMRNSTQIRGIHSALVLFSQGNNTYYPGYDEYGKPLEDSSVEFRFKEMHDDNYFTGEYMISPSETKTALTQTGVKVTTANYSYAMLNLSVADSPRNFEWRDTSNSEAVVLSDRAIANGKDGAIKSVHTNPSKDSNGWRGSIGWNDNHVTFEATHDQLDTQYADETFKKDNLFDIQGGSLIYAGNDKIVDPGSK